MSFKIIKDPNGTPMKMILLQVMEQDDQGPVVLRARRDHEKMDLSSFTEEQRNFLMVWAPINSVLGELRVDDIFSDYTELKNEQRAWAEHKEQQDERYARLQRDYNVLTELSDEKTTELKRLIRERDPERITKAIAVAVEEQTEILEEQLKTIMKRAVDLEREVNELKASKKKLKEANERLKENRK